MPNRSLEDHLFNRTPILPWKTRLEVMLGAAQGLAYLHEGLEVKVIYRDFKPSNVLLDESFKPKLSDFGLAREGPTGDRTHISTAVVRTYGYAAPEYVRTGHLTIQSDIWTFGVVLYEILTGRRAVERNRPTSEQKLLDWVKHFLLMHKSCLDKNEKERPTMSQVAESLKRAIQESSGRSSSVDKAPLTASSRNGAWRSK
ncbi:putative receptor-like protein kinase [Hibiscus syriacus]|uniref:Receptor-like protein kinase n=1 Tax=Hibiscus syriacus TaxID=106335 RepID=A0A6A2X8Y1_HIBSY|nr:putative receptor-like protein kinase [Hibiscus syriacus]